MADEMKMMSYGEWCRGKQHASAAAAVNSKRNLRAFGSKNLFTKKKNGRKEDNGATSGTLSQLLIYQREEHYTLSVLDLLLLR